MRMLIHNIRWNIMIPFDNELDRIDSYIVCQLATAELR